MEKIPSTSLHPINSISSVDKDNNNQNINLTSDVDLIDVSSNISVQDIKDEIIKQQSSLPDLTAINGFLVGKSMNEWLAESNKEAIPKKLCGELWHEGELCILFAYTGFGKSVLAVQIGNSISKGISVLNFKSETSKQSVLYFDFELSAKQFERRYSKDFKNHYPFDYEFKRVKPDINQLKLPEGKKYEIYLIEKLEEYIVASKRKIIIIDNLTDLRGDVEKAKDALPFMQKLNHLKEKYVLSLLILSHTPKRDALRPLSLNDLAGSAGLAQMCDSCFAIGQSAKEQSIKYIKQLKERYTERIYGEDNVIICKVEQPENILQFTFLRYGSERDLLTLPTDAQRDELENNVLSLYDSGKSMQKIADEFNISKPKVQRIIERNRKLKESENLEE